MIIAKLDGGMGNQLFQYAAGKSLSVRLKAQLKLDIDLYKAPNPRRYELNHFAIDEVFSSTIEKRTLKRKEYLRQKLATLGIKLQPYWLTEEKLEYNEKFSQLTDNVYLEGFWQSEKYFRDIEPIIRQQFKVVDSASGINSRYLLEISGVNAVSVHVRRGDYVTDKYTNSVHGVCEREYYTSAISLMREIIDQPRFYFFSDDPRWVSENLLGMDPSFSLMDHNDQAPYEDLRLMYSCSHHIIANSSFGWWGAWLNPAKGKKVVAPKKWFRTLSNSDIIPPAWLTI